MFRRLLSIAAAALIAAAGVMCASAETEIREVPVTAPPVMLVLGDSIATGYGLEGYDSGRENCSSYANILKEQFTAELPEDCGFKLTNRAVDGFTSGDLAELLGSGELDELLAEASCVTVSIGGNDLLHALWDALRSAGIGTGQVDKNTLLNLITSLGSLKDTLEQNLVTFESNLSLIASGIRSRTKGEFFIQTLYDPLESFSIVPGLSSLADEKITRLNEIIVSHSSDQGAEYTVSDVAVEFKGKARELTNISRIDIHPNAEGHKVIAQVLGKSITSKSYTYMQETELPETTAPAVTEPEETASAKPEETAPAVSVISSGAAAAPAQASPAETSATKPETASDDTDAAVDSVTSLQGNSGTVIAVVCAVCAAAAVAAAAVIIKKRRS